METHVILHISDAAIYKATSLSR